MDINFINSDTCKLKNRELYYFQHPNVLRDKLIGVIDKIGAQKFFKSSDKDVKKVRESIAEYFFALALKKNTGQDWYVRQMENDPPDFEMMTASEKLLAINKFELVEIPGLCKNFGEMINIFNEKQKKNYSERYSLLIFVNNDESKNWINLFDKWLDNYQPFKEIWAIYLLWYKGKRDFYGCNTVKLRPRPALLINFALNDEALRSPSSIPNYIEETKIDNKIFLNFKTKFIKDIWEKLRGK